MRFVVQPGMGLSYVLGTHAAAPRFFRRWIHEGATIYDVGANRGQMSLLFAALVGNAGHVVSFEPSRDEFESLERNVELNRLANVTTLRVAVADTVGPAQFAYSPHHPTQGKLDSVEPSYVVGGARNVVVNTVTLDSIAGTHPAPDVVKLDVEGAAAAVLRGARRIIESKGPTIFVELHGPEEQAGVRDELIAKGYVAETLNGDRVNDPTIGWNSPLWCYRPGAKPAIR